MAVAEALKTVHAAVLLGNESMVVGESVGDACAKAVLLEVIGEVTVFGPSTRSCARIDHEAVKARIESDLPNQPVRAWEF